MPITKVNVQKLECIINNWKTLPWTRPISDKDLEMTKELLSKVHNGQIIFNYKKNTNPFEARQYMVGVSPQSCLREVRNTIFDDKNDYDQVNSQPTILRDLLRQKGFNCPTLEDYVEDRKEWLDEICQIFNCNYDLAKQQIPTLINGGNIVYQSQRMILLNEEMKQIHQFLWNHSDFQELRQCEEVKSIGSFMAYLLQIYERKILDSALDYMEQVKGYDVSNVIKMFDGFMMDKIFIMTETDIEELNNYITEQTGFNVKIIQKPMKDIFDLSKLMSAKPDFTKISIKLKKESPEDKLEKLILQSKSGTTQDVAMVVCHLFKGQFVSVSIKNNGWYQFVKHRWVKTDSGVGLYLHLGHTVVNQYLHFMSKYSQMASALEEGSEKDKLIDQNKALSDVVYKLKDKSFKNKVLSECLAEMYDATFESRIDSNSDLLGFENGVYDLKNGIFRDGKPEDMVSLSTENDYLTFKEEDKKIVDIYTFMSQVFPKEDLRDYVFTLLSSFVEGKNPNEKFHIWTGVGGNGKSKLLELFELAMGKYATKIPVITLTEKNKASANSATPEIARLRGVRTVSTQEPEKESKFNIGIVKDWTGGDRITCRPLYGEQFDFKPQFKMVFCCNHLPILPPEDEGIWRRISVVHFTSRFVDNPNPNNPNEFKKDVHLTEKLREWKEAFMYILLEHYKLYLTEGLREPTDVKKATDSYHKDSDSVGSFCNEMIRKSTNPNAYLRIPEIEEAFKQSEFYDSSLKKKDFKALVIKSLGIDWIAQKKINGKVIKSVFMGVEWIEQMEDENTIDESLANEV